MARRPHILLIDDEPDLAGALAEYLTDLGYDVECAHSPDAAERAMARRPADLVVLDLNLRGRSGLDILRTLRQDGNAVPVLILSAQSGAVERIVGLEIGADDFVVKPVEPQELAARVGGLLRRHDGVERRLIQLEAVTVDLGAARLLRIGRQPERLGASEVALLRVLAGKPNHLFSREDLLTLAPGDSDEAGDRAIDVRIARLRRKLETESIQTVRGRGYTFVPPHPR